MFARNLIASFRASVICIIGCLALLASACAASQTQQGAPFALTPPYLTPYAAPAIVSQPTAALPTGNPQSTRTEQVFTDEQFGYEITVPDDWKITPLKGTSQGASELPLWSALISNVQVESLQSHPPDAAFVISIHRQPFVSEDELLLRIAQQLIAQPGDILRREHGKTIEYATAKMLADRFGRPTTARWFWDGKNLLTVSIIIFDVGSVDSELIAQVLDSFRLLNP